ncbi:MAG: RDD family protein [Gorillibacterium sp.]|nr:RDD family protein [Gorillibacterium sp.]
MNNLYTREAEIVTPEQVKLSFRTAGLGRRAVALLLDSLFLLAIFTGISLVIGLLMLLVGAQVSDGINDYVLAFLIILAALMIGGYYVWMEYYKSGQTFGKKWTGLRVVQENGQPITFVASIIRNFFRLIDFLPSFYFLGAAWMFFNSTDKRLGDLAAGTLVICDMQHERRMNLKRVNKWLHKGKFHENLTLYLSDEAKGKVTREDWVLLSTFVERIPSLEEHRRYEIAREIANRLGLKLEIRPNNSLITAEQFLVELYILLNEEWSL